MRVVNEYIKDGLKITVFHWNNRYLLKLERGHLEQTYKIAEWDITSESDLEAILSTAFLKEAADRFDAMAASLGEAMQGL
ncbi:MAG: hypothetical protein KF775_10515 [Cyclobacteriaceae bacterium]|nr:hypothetical protein [Cytophagales bacterium]MBX2900077.1 hypothetical protein [Cyclobacteriaceae bacterium]